MKRALPTHRVRRPVFVVTVELFFWCSFSWDSSSESGRKWGHFFPVLVSFVYDLFFLSVIDSRVLLYHWSRGTTWLSLPIPVFGLPSSVASHDVLLLLLPFFPFVVLMIIMEIANSFTTSMFVCSNEHSFSLRYSSFGRYTLPFSLLYVGKERLFMIMTTQLVTFILECFWEQRLVEQKAVSSRCLSLDLV